MSRSSRRRRLTALLLLLWQGAVLAPGAVAAHAAQQLPAGESQSVAQATMPPAKGIPAEVVQWFDAMREAADKDDNALALQMHEKVMAWVETNLPVNHVFRARVMVRYGYVLDKAGSYKEALTPTQKGAQMLRALAKTDPDPDIQYYLSVAMLNLGRRHTKLDQPESAIEAYQEAWKILHQQSKARSNSHQPISAAISQLGDEYKALGMRKQALAAYRSAISILKDQARHDPKQSNHLISIAITAAQTSVESGDNQQAKDILRSVVFSLRELSKTNSSLKVHLAAALSMLSLVFADSSSWPDALSAAQEAISIYRRIESSDASSRAVLLGTTLAVEGLSYNFFEKHMQALASSAEAARMLAEPAKTNPDAALLLATALAILGNSSQKVGQISQAITASSDAIAILRKTPKSNPRILPLLALSLSTFGTSSILSGDLDVGLKPAKEAIDIWQEVIKSQPLVRDYRHHLAFTQIAIGLAEAQLSPGENMLKPMQEAVQISRELFREDSSRAYLLSIALFGLGLQYSIIGRRYEALVSTKEAISIPQKLPLNDPGILALYTTYLGVESYQFAELGGLQDALSRGLEAVRLSRKLVAESPEWRYLLANSLSIMGSHYGKLGQDQDVLTIAGESLQIYRELAGKRSKYTASVASALILIGQAYARQGKWQLALPHSREAITLLRGTANSNTLARSELSLALKDQAKSLVNLGQDNQALASAREAVEIDRSLSKAGLDALEQLSESSTTLAKISLRQGQFVAAIPLLREAVISEVRFLQQQLPLMPEGRRQALVDTLGRRWELPYSLALQGEAGASLALYNRLNRHGPLQDIERRQGIISRSSGATQALVNRLSILNGQISNPTNTAKARQNALAETERLQEDLYRQLPALPSRLVEISEVARQLPPDAVLVEFQRFSPYNAAKPEKDAWGKPRYLALLLDQRGTPRAVDLGEAEAVDRAIATALDRTRFQQPDADRSWALVAETLFFPLRSALAGKRQLLLSPDGQLHRVPFGALALLAGTTPSLPATLTLHTIGSGRDLVTTSTQIPPATASLVLADPATTGWAPLDRAASEGQTVAASLRARLLLGRAASVAELQQARGPRILHVAGHGYFDPQATGDPLLASGLALAGADKARQPSRQSTPSPTPSGVPSDDGYLTAKEAARLQLEGTALVVLSACESGLGSERSGEGLFGLRRALTVAGARGTLLSLWKVPEHATETFMTRFYALLGQGIPPAEAVRRVQAEFRTQPRIDGWSDPFYWAGWQYSGLPDPAR
jgi:CHAT domain-containing protein